ncbi:MAG TPA: hypothetical protein VK281_09290 [Xanthobacteraceae bacterium]|nr:hypothetical protein [Xanthobacteraceae bacterium]
MTDRRDIARLSSGTVSVASLIPSTDKNRSITPDPRSWIERLWSSVADRGRSYAEMLQPEASIEPLDRAREFATALVSERGEASGAAVARELHAALRELRHRLQKRACEEIEPRSSSPAHGHGR